MHIIHVQPELDDSEADGAPGAFVPEARRLHALLSGSRGPCGCSPPPVCIVLLVFILVVGGSALS